MTGRPPSPERRPTTSRPPGPVAKLRSSLLLKILAALVVALVGSSALTGFLSSRLTSDALREQAQKITATNLRVLTQAFLDREATVIGGLRNLSQSLTADEMVEPGKRADLIQELGRVSGNLDLDILQVVSADGQPLEPSARVGDALAEGLTVTAEDRRSPASRLVTATDGTWMQAVLVPMGAGRDAYLLVGGYEFGDPFAYDLRRKLGDVGHVLLVADGKVVGSTFVDPIDEPPARNAETGVLPRTPVVVPVEDADNLVAYRTVGNASRGAVGFVGVSLSDPEASLNRSLSRTRLVAAAVLAAVALLAGWLFFRALVRPLVQLTGTARRIAGGEREASFDIRGEDEVAELGQALERMRLELRDQLDLIGAQAADLQDSSQRIVAAQDEERHRLARDLHDGIQQHLVVLRMGFGLVTEAAERSATTVHSSLQDLSGELDSVIERLREVSHDLYPSILVDRGLAAALRSSLARLPLSADLVCRPDPLPRLPPEVESGAYFLIGEALANALKHARAAEISVRLEVTDGWLRVDVSDDGQGFLAGAAAHRGGLLHMHDRARSFGGELTIDSAPGQGTVVKATFPIRGAVDVAPTG